MLKYPDAKTPVLLYLYILSLLLNSQTQGNTSERII